MYQKPFLSLSFMKVNVEKHILSLTLTKFIAIESSMNINHSDN